MQFPAKRNRILTNCCISGQNYSSYWLWESCYDSSGVLLLIKFTIPTSKKRASRSLVRFGLVKLKDTDYSTELSEKVVETKTWQGAKESVGARLNSNGVHDNGGVGKWRRKVQLQSLWCTATAERVKKGENIPPWTFLNMQELIIAFSILYSKTVNTPYGSIPNRTSVPQSRGEFFRSNMAYKTCLSCCDSQMTANSMNAAT